LQALGARLLDSSGEQVGLGGGALRSLDRVDLSDLDRRLKSARFVLAGDVDNPLLGDQGCARIYGPQKGATSRDIEELERGLARWASLVDYAAVSLPGAGAAGGVGYAALTVLGAIRRPGVEVVLELTGFQKAARGAVLVVTGEGSLDAQTLSGKAPVGVARAAGRLGVPAIAACGQCHVDSSTLASVGLGRAYALTDIEPCIEICISHPGPLLEDLAGRIARDLAGVGSPG
jgi:glycerate kinase